ncbi:MAG: M23 family metallopeptidase [Candidatus Buchananbacteria bacterium]
MWLNFYQHFLIKLTPLIRWLFLLLYKSYLQFKRQLKNWELKSYQGWLKLVTNQHFLTVLFVFGAGLVIIYSLLNSNRVQAQDYGQQSLIVKILGQNEELIEDSGPANTVAVVSNPDASEILNQLANETESDNTSAESLLLGSGALVKPEITTPEELKRTRVQKYIIQKGDTLYALAQRFNISTNTILWANSLTLNSYLKPGATLNILPVSGVLHKVKKGDTISSIAKKYQATEEKIENFNYVSNNTLTIGDTLVIPEGKIIYQAPAVVTPAKTKAPTTVYQSTTVSAGGMIWPTTCRRITQYFRGIWHTGADVACGLGAPIYAADNGVVAKVVYGKTGYGYYIIINHGNGKYTLYGHNSKIYVEPGQTVERGELISAMGSTGRSTGPHLHFEVRLGGVNGTRVNPLSYIR